MYFLFDQAFLNGIITDTYVFNYQGKLLGCKQIVIVNRSIADYTCFLLIKKKWKSRTIYWILIAITCFSVLTAIINFQVAFRVNAEFSEKYIRLSGTTILFLALGTYIFLFTMSSKERIQTILIALPSFVIGSLIWYRWIGPVILPIVT